MEEVIQLLGLLGLGVVGNILGGIYVNVNVKNFKFDLPKFLNGIVKAICVAFMFIALSYILEKVPNLSQTLGIEPKAMIISAIGIYVVKIGNHLINVFGLQKQQVEKAEKEVVEKIEKQYLDM